MVIVRAYLLLGWCTWLCSLTGSLGNGRFQLAVRAVVRRGIGISLAAVEKTIRNCTQDAVCRSKLSYATSGQQRPLKYIKEDGRPNQEMLSRMFERCARPIQHLPARQPGDLNRTRLRAMELADLSPTELSADPLIVAFGSFLTCEEVKAVESHMFLGSFRFQASYVGNQQLSTVRDSLTFQCLEPSCTQAEIIKTIRRRSAKLLEVPVDHLEQLEALRYTVGKFYDQHHDNLFASHPTSMRPSGARIFSLFIYLSDVERGGETVFPQLGLHWKPRKGSALLFTNTMDDFPEVTDTRTLHKANAVEEGEKRGVNVWVRQYSYVAVGDKENDYQCDRFFDGLAAMGHADAIVESTSIVAIENIVLDSEVQVFSVHRNTGHESLVRVVRPGQKEELDCVAGDIFALRSGSSGELIRRYQVRGGQPSQVISISEGPTRHMDL